MATKVTFELSANIVAEATSGILVGEFNNWDFNNGISLKRQKDGSMKASVELENGKTYEYRYFLNDGRWVNDDRADKYTHVSGYNVDNCVVSVPVVEKTAPVKAEKAVKAETPKAKAPAKAKTVKAPVTEEKVKAPTKTAKKATTPKVEAVAATPAKKVAKKAAK